MTEIIEPGTLVEDERQALAKQLVAHAKVAGIDPVRPGRAADRPDEADPGDRLVRLALTSVGCVSSCLTR
jgi:hypothetical protein